MMPFAGGLESLPNGTLLFSLAASMFYLLVQGRQPSWRRTVAKTASVALLALLAVLEGGPVLLVAALALSAAGDAFLAQDGETPFMAGLASFLAAHAVYTVLFLGAGGGLAIMLAELWRIGLVVLAIALAGALLGRLLPAVGAALRVPVTVYTLAILAMMLSAATIPSPVVLVGAVLFVISDALLAIDRFLAPARAGARDRRLGALVWPFYYCAQLLITLGFLL